MALEASKMILRQLGGNKFIAMTGAKQFVGSNNSLSFQLPKANKKIKGVRITVNSADLYDMTFGYFDKKKFQWVDVAKYENVYFDQMTNIFTRETGLYTSL
jgi:hypothetical protein